MKPLLIALALAVAVPAWGQSAEIAHPDARTEARLKDLATELRCLVCQNQTIADSNAPLALDLRQQIRTQIAEGRSDDQIRAYMVERYGDFVLYKPPFRATTALLWIGPFALIALGLGIFLRMVRRRRTAAAAPDLQPEKRARIQALLDADPDQRP